MSRSVYLQGFCAGEEEEEEDNCLETAGDFRPRIRGKLPRTTHGGKRSMEHAKHVA